MTDEGRDEIAEPVPNLVRNPAPRNDRKENPRNDRRGREVLIARIERNVKR